MKAAVYKRYGKPGVVHIQDVKKPMPGKNDVVVKVNASTLTAGDWRMRAGNPFIIRLYNGLFKIKRPVLGHEFAGVVDRVGEGVAQFQKGDLVFGSTGEGAGAHAEDVVVPANGVLVHRPGTITDAVAATLPVGACTALYFLHKANIERGQKVLIYGASGSVGTYAVQLAKYFGAEVTAVCSHSNADLVRSLGADKVIDYTKEDFSVYRDAYDVIFDAVGKTSFTKSKNALKPKGTYLTVAMSPGLMLQSALTKCSKRYKLISDIARPTMECLRFLTILVENHALRSVIDRTYSFADIRKAHAYAETGHKKGNVVIEIGASIHS